MAIPALVEFFDYLDELRASGVTNMFGAGLYLQNAFGIDREEARKVTLQWIKTFSMDKPAVERAAEATA